MQAIRKGNLYPGAKREPDAWKTYCKERWGMSDSMVKKILQAVPVLRRLSESGALAELPSVTAAAAVATLPEPVQDLIFEETIKRDEVKELARESRRALWPWRPSAPAPSIYP